MNAQILRKWSPFKSLMYLWLIFLVLFSIIWCSGAVAMHLTPVNLTKDQQSSQQQQHYISVDDGGGRILNYNNYISRSNSSSSSSKSNTNNSNKPSRSELDQKLLTTHLHQITNNSHHNIQWMLSPESSVSSVVIPLPLNLQPDSNNNNNKRTNEIARWRHRMNEKRARIRAHRRTLLLPDTTARSRRESLTSLSHHTPLHQHHRLALREREHKRYCSARDPAVLAFEAPTVFEGKIKSMSHNRQGPYSVTFECVHVYKQPAGFVIPPRVRLRFETTENRTECDIYRQEFKQRGPIRGDVLEQGKLYFLFVKQIDVGNFTILGQPIRKTKKTEKEVRLGASNNYGE